MDKLLMHRLSLMLFLPRNGRHENQEVMDVVMARDCLVNMAVENNIIFQQGLIISFSTTDRFHKLPLLDLVLEKGYSKTHIT